MASRYEISTIFKMIDNWSGPMKKIAGSSTVLAKKVSADMQKTKMQIQAAGRAMKAMAGVAAGAGVALAGKTVVDSVKTYVEFEDAVTKAGTKFKDLDVTSAGYNDTLELMQTKAREVGAATKFSATDAAGALDKMAMAGITSDDAMKMLMGTTNLAAAAGTDLTTAVDIATDALGIYGKDLASKGFAGVDAQLDKISDVMAKTGVLANTDLQGLFEAMTYAGPSFVTAGQSIETFSAAMGTLASAGIKGSSAGTALNAIFTQLGNADKRAKLEGLGVSVQDAQGNFRNLIDIVADLEKSLGGMGNVEKKSLLNSIFDVRGEKAITALMTAGSDAVRDFENRLINSQGTAATVANTQMKSFAGMIEQLKSAWQDKQLSLGKAFEVGGAKDALQNLITYVQNFDVAPIAGALTKIMQAIPGIVEGFVGFVQTLWNLREIIISAAIAWGIYKAVMIVVNLVMMANPANLILVGIMALITGIVMLIRNWDSVCEAMAKVWEWMKNIASIIWEGLLVAFDKVKSFFLEFRPLISALLGPVGMLVNMIVEVVENFDNIKKAFSEGGFIAGIKTIGGTIISAVLAPIQNVFELLSKIPGVGSYFDGKAAGLADFRADALSGFGAMDNVAKMQLANSSVPTSVQSLMAKQNNVTAPVTQGERTAYSVTENNNNTSTEVTVTLDKGLKGTASGNAPNVTVQSVSSASWK